MNQISTLLFYLRLQKESLNLFLNINEKNCYNRLWNIRFVFCKFITKKWKQDGAVIRIQEIFGDEIQILETSGETFGIGSGITLGKISQAYSQHVKKLNTPFVFEGVEVPATNIGKQIAEKYKFNYPVGNWDDLRSWESIYGSG